MRTNMEVPLSKTLENTFLGLAHKDETLDSMIQKSRVLEYRNSDIHVPDKTWNDIVSIVDNLSDEKKESFKILLQASNINYVIDDHVYERLNNFDLLLIKIHFACLMDKLFFIWGENVPDTYFELIKEYDPNLILDYDYDRYLLTISYYSDNNATGEDYKKLINFLKSETLK